MQRTQVIMDVVRRLKMRWPTTIKITRFKRASINDVSGEQIFNTEELVIRRAILLPQTEARKFIYDLAYLAGAGVNFVHGGLFEAMDTYILIDNKDLNGFKPSAGDQVIIQFKPEVYEINKTQTYGHDEAWAIALKAVKGVTKIL